MLCNGKNKTIFNVVPNGHFFSFLLHFIDLLLLFLIIFFLAVPQYPLVRDNIYGEETATFTNGAGESIELQINDSQAETAECLLKILDGDNDAAEALAEEVHRLVICPNSDIEKLPDLVN